MKKFGLALAILVLTILFVFPIAAHAAPLFQSDAPPFDLMGGLVFAVKFVLGSAAIASAAAFLTNTAKSAGWVTDGQSLTWASVINFVLVLIVFAARLLYPEYDLPKVIEQLANSITQMGPGFILPLMPLLVALSKWVHEAMRGVAVFGTSLSAIK